jgi:hypothetical protein
LRRTVKHLDYSEAATTAAVGKSVSKRSRTGSTGDKTIPMSLGATMSLGL